MTSAALSVRDPWAMVPSIGNLDAYISAVNRITLLTPREEVSEGVPKTTTSAVLARRIDRLA